MDSGERSGSAKAIDCRVERRNEKPISLLTRPRRLGRGFKFTSDVSRDLMTKSVQDAKDAGFRERIERYFEAHRKSVMPRKTPDGGG